MARATEPTDALWQAYDAAARLRETAGFRWEGSQRAADAARKAADAEWAAYEAARKEASAAFEAWRAASAAEAA